MTASFRRVDYSLRPAKHAERRMLAEVFRHLRPFQPVDDYVYVGFGSLWFSDFSLFHRLLGIRTMVSIEREVSAQQRINANKPFASIRVDYRPSEEVLPTLDWDRRHFVWLDYDDPLAPSMLLDVRSVAARATSGSLLAVSTQCQKAPDVAEAERSNDGIEPLERFMGRFGREKIPQGTEEAELYGWPFGSLSRQMLVNDINDALSTRNSSLPSEEHMSFEQICDFEYDDSVKMTTVVGVFVADGDRNTLDECRFNGLDFLPSGKKLVRIAMPKLTVREIREIEMSLPWPNGTQPALGAIPPSDAKRFAEFYRYLPNFAVLEN